MSTVVALWVARVEISDLLKNATGFTLRVWERLLLSLLSNIYFFKLFIAPPEFLWLQWLLYIIISRSLCLRSALIALSVLWMSGRSLQHREIAAGQTRLLFFLLQVFPTDSIPVHCVVYLRIYYYHDEVLACMYYNNIWHIFLFL